MFPFSGFSLLLNSEDYKLDIIDSQQYLVCEYIPETEQNCYYIMRSVSINVDCFVDSLYIDMSRLYNGTMNHGEFAIDGYILYAERDNDYTEYVDSLKCVPSARLPYPFNKILNRGDQFRINLCYPDVIDIETILSIIRVHDKSVIRPLWDAAMNEMIKQNSITIQALPFLKNYAGYIYGLYSTKEFNKLTFWENNLIPYILSDEYMGNRPYFLDIQMLRRGCRAYYYANDPDFLQKWFDSHRADDPK